VGYTLGLDLGTTSSAAAVNDGTAARMLSVDHSVVVIPSVVHIDGDGTVLVGSAAERRAIGDHSGIAREFKRRFGDPEPMILSGTPVSANDLLLEVAKSLIDIATSELGAAPTEIVVCHPANWGNYKVGLLSDTLTNSALPPHRLISEPEAAAIHYASEKPVGDGEIIAVYGLGGATFDAVVLRKAGHGPDEWEVLGEPRGIERLGGIDFDLAVFHHVLEVLSLDVGRFGSEDGPNQTAMLRFRAECREAKHALSTDSTATVPVLLPGYSETVQITRGEFETLIDPAISRTIDALQLAIGTTGLELADVDRILLVGGSTRVPLVAERLAAATNRPIEHASQLEHAVALGAAEFADPAGPTTTTASAAPSHSDLYNLPHIDEQPLPDFMQSRAASSRGGSSVPGSSASGPIPSGMTVPAPSAGSPVPPTPPPQPSPGAEQPLHTTVGAVVVDERLESRSPVTVFLVSFAVVAAALTAVLLVLNTTGDDTDASTGGSATTEQGDDDAPTFETSCSAEQLPDPNVRYQVTRIPDTFAEPTLNGRNVPSTVSVDGVTSRPITSFPEFSELDLTYTGCEVAENGRVWWAVQYTGPDLAGGTYSGVVWSSTLFIEPVPS